jgi:hypothetical protein
MEDNMRKLILLLMALFISILLLGTAKNQDEPEKGKWDFNKQKVWEIDGAGETDFARIQNVGVAEDGRLYVLDSKHSKIFIFSPEGKFISSFGKRGEGPGEIKRLNMGRQLHCVDGNVIVTETGRIHHYSSEGQFRKTLSIPGNLTPRGFFNKDSFVSAPLMVFIAGENQAKLTVYDEKEKKARTIAQYKPFKKASHSRDTGGRRMVVGIVIGGITPMMLVEVRKGKIYYGMNDSYQINVVNSEGKNLNTIYLEGRKPKPVTSDVKKQIIARLPNLDNIPKQMVDHIMNGLPDKAALYSALFIDKNGFIYSMVSDPAINHSREFDIFSPTGKYVYSADISINHKQNIRNIVLRDDTLILVTEDEEGEIKLTKYLISLPTD